MTFDFYAGLQFTSVIFARVASFLGPEAVFYSQGTDFVMYPRIGDGVRSRAVVIGAGLGVDGVL